MGSVEAVEPGTMVGPFEVEVLVARGAGGSTYRARHTGTLERAALKLLGLERRGEDATRELDALTMVRHPGLAELVAHGDDPEVGPWLATRWIDGRTLARLTDVEGELPLRRVISILEPVAAALDELSAVGLRHGDMSPRNVMVDVSDRGTLIDLGLTAPEPDPELTADHHFSGTPRYLAPEAIGGQPQVGASDRYSLAVVAYESLTGVAPFETDRVDASILHDHLHASPVPVSERRPDLTASADSAFERALSKAPTDRHRTAGDFVLALNDQRRSGRRRVRPRVGRPAAIAGALSVLAAVMFFVFVGGDDTPDGTERLSSECNLIEVARFERGQLGLNYFLAPADTGRLVDGVGNEGSAAVELGADTYGLYGELVADLDAATYDVSAWMDVPGEAGATQLVVSFLDAEFEPSDEPTWENAVDVSTGTRTVEFEVTRPAGAMHAVAHVRTDGGAPIVVDDLLFAATTCPG